MSMVWLEEVTKNELDRAQKLLAGVPGGLKKAVTASLKRAASKGKTESGKFATAEYTIKRSDYTANTTVRTIANGEMGVTIQYAGHNLSLMKFNTHAARGAVVTTQVRQDSGVHQLNEAFGAAVSGGYGVFERVGRSRLPIEKKYSLSTASMMKNEKVTTNMGEVITETFSQRMEHEINRILNGW